MIGLLAKVDKDERWSAYTSMWSALEVARALRKDGKPSEIVKIDLRELRTHRIGFEPVTNELLRASEKLVASTNLYAADSLHIATCENLNRTRPVSWFVCDDKHFERFKVHVRVIKLSDLKA